MTEFEPLLSLVDKLGLVGVLLTLLYWEKKQAAEWQARYMEVSEKLLASVLRGE